VVTPCILNGLGARRYSANTTLKCAQRRVLVGPPSYAGYLSPQPWLRQGILKQPHRDRREWRLFTEDDLIRIRAESMKIVVQYIRPEGENNEH
jgi:hypothetical protein